MNNADKILNRFLKKYEDSEISQSNAHAMLNVLKEVDRYFHGYPTVELHTLKGAIDSILRMVGK